VADLDEVFEYPFTPLDPVRGDHVDPPTGAVYETLLVKGPDGRPRPGLADAWNVSRDGRTWRLRIREGAYFHSGRECDARAVVEALELCRWGDGFARQVWYWDAVDTVVAEDPRTVAVRLHRPSSRLPVLLWGAHTAIVNSRTWQRLGVDFGVSEADGTGPYRLLTYSPHEVVAERITRQSSQPGTIRWRSIPDEDARQRAISDGTADAVRYVRHLPGGSLARWRLDRQPENSQFYLALNFTDRRGFADRAFRRSIDAFVDRDELVGRALGGEGDGRRSPIPAADEFAESYEPNDVAPLTRAEAHATLRALGWVVGTDGVLEREGQSLRLDCVAQDTTTCRRIAAVLAEQLRPAGVELRMSYVELFAPFYRAVEAGPAAFLSKWLWPDAMEAVYGFSRADCSEPAGGNWQSADCPEVDDAFDDFARATSEEELELASAAVQRAFMQELPYLPLVSPIETLAVGPRVQGLRLQPRTLYPLYDQVEVPSLQESEDGRTCG
jgi:peptide/nickel transport system substrate-binding protein